MKVIFLFLALSAVSSGADAKSFGCIWAESKLKTAIEMQADYAEKQRFYVRENGRKSDRYEWGINNARESEREARAEVKRKCD